MSTARLVYSTKVASTFSTVRASKAPVIKITKKLIAIIAIKKETNLKNVRLKSPFIIH